MNFNIGYVVFVFIDQSINQSSRIEPNQIKSINQSYQSNQSSNRSVNGSTVDRSIHQSNNQIIYIYIYFRTSIIDSYIFYKYRKRERERGREEEKNSPNNSSAKYIILSLRSMTGLSRFSWVLPPPQSHVS